MSEDNQNESVNEEAKEEEEVQAEDTGTAGEEFTEESVQETSPSQEESETKTAKDLDAVFDVPIKVQAILGNADIQVSQLLKLGRGAVIELNRKVGEAIDIYANNRLIARGEVVIVEDKLGVTMTEIIKSDASQAEQ